MTGATRGKAPPAAVTVFIVDDDDALRASLRLLLETEGLAVADYDCADAFLAQCTRGCRGCVISDIHMPGVNGLELQATLEARGIRLPLIMLTGQADVPAAVQALKAGALDFLEKPFDPEALLAQVARALALDAERHAEQAEHERRESLLARLTPREREVIERVAAGQSNKVVALDLDISERTVELHRGRGMKKLEVRAVADLVRLLAGRLG
jgi:FixJ family two-component response regulator